MVRGNSKVRTATNHFIHLDNDYEDETVRASLMHVQEIVDAHQAHEKAHKEALMREGKLEDEEEGEYICDDPNLDIDIVEASERLGSLIIDSNNYFNVKNRGSEVEDHVDSHLSTLHKEARANNDGSTFSDLHILMSWLEKFMPANGSSGHD